VSFSVVLDTCVLYPAHLCDTLLRLAELGLYRVLWSEDILEELSRNLRDRGIDGDAVDRRLSEMSGAFPGCRGPRLHRADRSMRCDPKDRHVLAAAVRADSGAIVTFNTRDFPDHALTEFQIEVVHPDEFLLDTLDLAPRIVIDELAAQAAANRRAPKTLPSLLRALEVAGVPRFADQVRRQT